MANSGATLQELKELLRDSLRLGKDIEVTDDFPLINGPIDLDSIDILLVISTIERRYGMKITSDSIDRSAFQTVRTLANFIDNNRVKLAAGPAAAANAAAAAAPPEAQSEQYLSRLPQGPEFRFVSSVRQVVEGEEASGVWHVNGNESFFAGHFPGRPVVPGVLLAEAMAQMAGLAAGGVRETAVLSSVEISFLAPVVPPAAIELRARVMRDGADAGAGLRRCETTASVRDSVVARGTVTLKFKPLA
jgi:3-hydroxyacyl-[acyl-carrier-protein] dehydratase